MSEKLIEALNNHFEKHRIIFWYDDNGIKRDLFLQYKKRNIKKLEIENNELWIKYHLLKEYPKEKFLVYSPHKRPADQENWLLDLNNSQFIFSTNETALYLRELDLPNTFEVFVQEHADFFRNKNERLEPFRRQLEYREKETVRSLSYAMLSVLSSRSIQKKSVRRDLRQILIPVLEDALLGNGEYMEGIQKYGLEDFFWGEVEKRFQYSSEERSLKGLVYFLFQSAFSFEKRKAENTGTGEAFTFIDIWRTSIEYIEGFKEIAQGVERDLNIQHELSMLDMDTLLSMDLFKGVDNKVLGYLTSSAAKDTIETERALALIRSRRERFWYNADKEGKIRDYYLALEAFFTYQLKKHGAASLSDSAVGLWKQYGETLYQLDYWHRKFIYHYQRTTADENFHELLQVLEKHYVNSFLFSLQVKWEECLEKTGIGNVHEVAKQRDFFAENITPYLDKDKVVFVIISDALRYEVGVELKERLVKNNRFTLEVESLLGSVPSYTQLGMAALLPHKTLEIDTEKNVVMVNGKNSSGIQNRNSLLNSSVSKNYSGKKAKAMQAQEFASLSLEEQTREIEGIDCFYLFSNKIDSVGDGAKTETSVAGAMEEEINFIVELCKKITNLNRTHIIITADHGFLYQHLECKSSDMISPSPSSGEILRNRRFIIGKELRPRKGLTKFKGGDLGLQEDIDVLIPQGLSRIRRQGGGLRFVHGGISLQEIFLPLLFLKKGRSDDVDFVDVEVMKRGELITSGQVDIKFFQSQPVDEKLLPRNLIIRFESQNGQILSNQVEAIFDSTDPYDQNRGRMYNFTFNKDAGRFNNQHIVLKLYEKKDGGTRVYYNEYTYRYRTTIEKDFDL